MTHRDFRNYRYNPVYSIVVDDKTVLKKKYNLDIIYANKGKLYNMRRAYGEMSKLYYIYQLYKNGTNSSKYIGLNHYRRYFNFTDIIPNLNDIFNNYDAILGRPYIFQRGIKLQFCDSHDCKKYDEMVNIIKDIKPQYYQTAMAISKEKKFYCCNLFIMKKQDFLKYCEFIFDILFEFDRRNNFTSDQDLFNYVKKIYVSEFRQYYQTRLEAFLSERIGNIFYSYHFKKIKIFNFGYYGNFTKYFRKKNKSK